MTPAGASHARVGPAPAPSPATQPPFTRVAIVARTKMGGGACVGVMTQSGRAVRPLPVGGFCHPPHSPFQVGEVWEMHLRARDTPEPPHMEDHDEWGARRVGTVADLPDVIRRFGRPVKGEPAALFDATLRFRDVGSAYIPRAGPQPLRSVEFWIVPHEMTLEPLGDKFRYSLHWPRRLLIPYVGVEPPVERVPAGTLARVSLARWWLNPNHAEEGETCALQLSGWFGLPRAAPLPPQVFDEKDIPF